MAATDLVLAASWAASGALSMRAESGAKRAILSGVSAELEPGQRGPALSPRAASPFLRAASGAPCWAIGRCGREAADGLPCRKSALNATPAVTSRKTDSAMRACPGVIILTPVRTPRPQRHYSSRFLNELLTGPVEQPGHL